MSATPTAKTADAMVGALSTTRVTNPFGSGHHVLIPAGTPLRSTHPRRKGVYLSKRAQTITVFSAMDGYIDLWNDADHGRGFVHLPTLSWPGAGGYWVDAKVTPELAAANGVTAPALPTLFEYDRRLLDVEPGFGLGYDNRDA